MLAMNINFYLNRGLFIGIR